MSDSSHTDDTDFLAGAGAISDERAVSCETRAEHGCCVDGVDICGDGCHVVGLSDGVFSECPGSVVSRSLSQYMKCYDNQVVNV